jgi:hypothetical protein
MNIIGFKMNKGWQKSSKNEFPKKYTCFLKHSQILIYACQNSKSQCNNIFPLQAEQQVETKNFSPISICVEKQILITLKQEMLHAQFHSLY